MDASNVPSSESTTSDRRSRVALLCPMCNSTIAVESRLAGRGAVCPMCTKHFTVPLAAKKHIKKSRGTSTPQNNFKPTTHETPRATTPSQEDRAVNTTPSDFSTPTTPPSPRVSAPPDNQLSAVDKISSDIFQKQNSTVPEASLHTDDTYSVRDHVRTIGTGENRIQLRRLTPAELHNRRTKRTLITLIVGVTLLFILMHLII